MPNPTDGDRADIEAVLAHEARAWTEGDAETFAPVTEDVIFTNVFGIFSVGREPFVAQHRRLFSTNWKGSTMTQALESLAFVRPDVAVAASILHLRGFSALPPNVTAIDGALVTRLQQVMVREGGAWRVAAFHNVAVHPAALGPAPDAQPPSPGG